MLQQLPNRTCESTNTKKTGQQSAPSCHSDSELPFLWYGPWTPHPMTLDSTAEMDPTSNDSRSGYSVPTVIVAASEAAVAAWMGTTTETFFLPATGTWPWPCY